MSDTRKFLEAVMDGRTPVQSYNPATRRYEDKYLRYNDAKEEIEELGSVGFGQSMMPKAQNVPQGNMQTPTLGSRGFSSSFDDIRPKRSMSENVSEFMVTNPASRAVGLSLQGMANASFNPAGHLAKSFGMDMRPIEPKNWVERGIEKGSEYAYDGAVSAIGFGGVDKLGMFGQGVGKASKAMKVLFQPQALGVEAASSFAGGAVTGMTEPEGALGHFGANSVGNVGAGLARGVPKALGVVKNEFFDVAGEVSQIKRAYKKLENNPLAGDTMDELVTIKPKDDVPTVWRRGAAIIGDDGKVITHGRKLKGTERNFGMNKSIYLHEMSLGDMRKAPRLLRKYNPVEVTQSGTEIYRAPYGSSKSPITIALRNEEGKKSISSMYRNDTHLSPLLSTKKPQPTIKDINLRPFVKDVRRSGVFGIVGNDDLKMLPPIPMGSGKA